MSVEKRIGPGIIAGLKEAIAFERGELQDVETRTVATKRASMVEAAPAEDRHPTTGKR